MIREFVLNICLLSKRGHPLINKLSHGLVEICEFWGEVGDVVVVDGGGEVKSGDEAQGSKTKHLDNLNIIY